MAGEKSSHVVSFTIPIFEPLPSMYYVRILSEHWLHAEAMLAMPMAGLILPDRNRTHTELLDLDPLPRSALHDPVVEAMYKGRFSHFNPIQTQVGVPRSASICLRIRYDRAGAGAAGRHCPCKCRSRCLLGCFTPRTEAMAAESPALIPQRYVHQLS